MPYTTLPDRAVFAVTGEDAETFLQSIITTDLDKLAAGEARGGALLTPQGKILFDFLISRLPDGFRIECRADVAADLAKRLTLYKLRAKVTIAQPEQALVGLDWQDDSGPSAIESTFSRNDSTTAVDRRFAAPATVRRLYEVAASAAETVADWHRFRIAQGVPESGDDYALGDAFPHDVLLDQTGSLGLRKGCYIGQEVVSRMHHRGTARRRVLLARADAPLPAPGTAVLADGRPVGSIGSVDGMSGLALVRIDKVKAAMDAGTPVTADGVALRLSIPAWATFGFPEAAADEA